jgi:hypothetical protein
MKAIGVCAGDVKIKMNRGLGQGWLTPKREKRRRR